MKDTEPVRVYFGVFELNLKSGELRSADRKTLLQEQPLQILRMLLAREGEIVTREEIRKQLWPNDTIVEFDHSINAAMKRLRQVLGDSADEPKYIQTVASRGYRLLVPVEWAAAPESPAAAPSIAAGGNGTATARQTDPTVLTGRTVSHYRVLEVIGGGGMGVVYRAEDLKLGRQVALKFLPEDLGSEPEAMERFSREARAASSLDHVNICSIHEFGEHDGRPFIVMPLLKGQNLRDRLAALAANNEKLPFDQLLDIAIQIADGLQAAHDKSIVHRDIKPANIVITEKGVVKILDFGLAKLLRSSHLEDATAVTAVVACPSPSTLHLTRTGSAMGTAGYMSPEQVRGEKLDARTDIFSFGLVLYEMATGHRAFSGDTAAQLHAAILNNSPIPLRTLNPNIPAKLAIVIDRCLKKEREQRYQSAAEISKDLKELAAPKALKKWLAVTAMFLLALAGTSAVIYKKMAAAKPALDLQNMKMTEVTDTGDVGTAAISPDGRFLAYTLQKPDHSLWVQQAASGSRVPAVAPTAAAITSVTFSPDGNYLYFVREDRGYVVPTLGGTPKEIIPSTFGAIGVSPDGTKLAFVHGDFGDAPKSQLLVVNSDGSGQRVIAEYPRLSQVAFNSTASPSWSPDGRLIAMTAMRQTDYVLNIYPAAVGPAETIPMPDFAFAALWLTDSTGILLGISPTVTAPRQIWFQPYPRGKLQRLTNDLDGYRSLSITRDGSVLAAIRVQSVFTIFISPASQPEQATAIRSGKIDGVGLLWTSEGKLLSEGVGSEFRSFTADGKQQAPFAWQGGLKHPGDFDLCKNGKMVVATGRAYLTTIWRADDSGRLSKRLSNGPMDLGPDCSPDGRSVIYISYQRESAQLMRVSVDGGTPVKLSEGKVDVTAARYSPDGQEIADVERSTAGFINGGSDSHSLVIRDAGSGEVKKSFALPKGFEQAWNAIGRALRWRPDGQSVTYVLWKGPGTPTNLWSQSLFGGPPRQITDVPDAIVAYDWSPDGKQLAFTRLAQTQDVVFISNFH